MALKLHGLKNTVLLILLVQLGLHLVGGGLGLGSGGRPSPRWLEEEEQENLAQSGGAAHVQENSNIFNLMLRFYDKMIIFWIYWLNYGNKLISLASFYLFVMGTIKCKITYKTLTGGSHHASNGWY